MKLLGIAAALRITLGGPVFGESFSGVAGVVDGDTIAVQQVKVRLEGIDAPEVGQSCTDEAGQPWACGMAATTHLIKLVDRREVICELVGTDRYGRRLGLCRLPGLQNSINSALVRTGMARAYVKYSLQYVSEEKSARADKLGIWAGPHEAPWDYRTRIKEVSKLK